MIARGDTRGGYDIARYREQEQQLALPAFLRLAAAVLLFLWAVPDNAIAQTPTKGRGVKELVRTVCGAQTLTLEQVARAAKPSLWFSPDEPIDIKTIPRALYRSSFDGGDRVAYYRVRKVKFNGRDDFWARVFSDRFDVKDGGLTSRRGNQKVVTQLALSAPMLSAIRQVVIRYLFYYPAELGTGEHLHDLESAEYDIEPVYDEVTDCAHVYIRRVYGSAHGLGLFTNVLDVEDVAAEDRDVRMRLRAMERATGNPATVAAKETRGDAVTPGAPEAPPVMLLVEEGKHATAPDRNGDGVYTPGFDVNRYAFDAWGIRDSMRSKSLSPGFRADMLKVRTPDTIVADYELKLSTDDHEVCGGEKLNERDRRQHLAEIYSGRVPEQGASVTSLLNGKGFCDDAQIESRLNLQDVTAFLGLGGAYNGYTRWWERISASLRWDGGAGWTTTIPRGIAVPGLGGWLVGRISGPWPGGDARKSVDVLYMPSSSRMLDWYVGGGYDWGEFAEQDEGRVAYETGVKGRVPLKSVFLGARLGVRFNHGDPLRSPRLIVEAGAGIW